MDTIFATWVNVFRLLFNISFVAMWFSRLSSHFLKLIKLYTSPLGVSSRHKFMSKVSIALSVVFQVLDYLLMRAIKAPIFHIRLPKGDFFSYLSTRCYTSSLGAIKS